MALAAEAGELLDVFQRLTAEESQRAMLDEELAGCNPGRARGCRSISDQACRPARRRSGRRGVEEAKRERNPLSGRLEVDSVPELDLSQRFVLAAWSLLRLEGKREAVVVARVHQ